MSGFEFFFSFYGLVLGLSVVEIVSGFARLVHDRRGIRVGWLVPALAILMLLDLANFWMSAFVRLQSYEPTYGLLVIGLTVSALYYVAASAVFHATSGPSRISTRYICAIADWCSASWR